MYSIPSDDESDFMEDGSDAIAPKFQLFEKHLDKLKSRDEKTPSARGVSDQASGSSAINLKLPSHGCGDSAENVSKESESSSAAAVAAAAVIAGRSAGVVEFNQTVVKSTTKQATSGGGAGYRILVNKKQKGNPVLKFIRNVPWEYDTIIPDYELGLCNCALYLSLKYHNRFPEYIHNRLKELGKKYELRILLVQVDTKQQDVSHELNQLAKICMLADCTLILAFSYEEAGRYLEVYKAYEHKQPTEIMGKTSTDFISQANDCLTSIKGINKTDVTTLLSRFKTMKNVMAADVDTLGLCPGIGPLKARRLHAAFHTPFLKNTRSSTKQEAETFTAIHSGKGNTANNTDLEET